MDRSVATGTGYVGQYSPDVQKLYETVQNTPEELILFFHHLPYSYKLRSGKTVIQTIYDSHYEGAAKAANFVSQWKSLRGHVDDQRYQDVLAQLSYQADHAIVWRDAICDWVHRVSQIPDEKGRVGNHGNRIQAEKMQLEGYAPVDIISWERASVGKAITCTEATKSCAARLKFEGKPGWYTLSLEYFDQINGASKYRVLINQQLVDEWIADRRLPATTPNSDSSVRRHIPGLALRPGDEVRIEGFPDKGEHAPLEYVEIIAM